MTTYNDSFNNVPVRRINYTYWRYNRFDIDNTDLDEGNENRVNYFRNYSLGTSQATLLLSDPTHTTVEVCGDDPATIQNLSADPGAVWVEVTSAALMQINYPVIALRFTNTGTGLVSVVVVEG